MPPKTEAGKSLRRILIVDDNPDIHNDFNTILSVKNDLTQLENLERELFGGETPQPQWKGPRFELSFASQGKEGVEQIKSAMAARHPFQLAFVDMRMPPGWDGLKTIREIWRVDPSVQVVLCTAYSDYSWEEIHQHLGPTDNLLILNKPFDSAEVSQMSSTLTQKWLVTKQAEMKQDELEWLVNQRTEELHLRNQQLNTEMAERKALEEQLVRSQKMDAIGTMAAGVAHDLNNILSGILSYPDLLLMKIQEDDPMYRPLSIIQKSGRKAAAIVRDMLTLARRNVAVKETIDLTVVVKCFLDGPECRAICEYHPGVRIVSRFDADPFPVSGSAVHLEKLVMNLISNGAEAMEGGGEIVVDIGWEKLEEPLPGYDAVMQGDYAKLVVTDQGTGIDPNDMDHIFEPFFTKKELGRSGTGLGMTVVWDTVNHHDGYIAVESRKGEGTTISVYLPISDKGLDVVSTTAVHEDLTGHGEHILVVDDMAEQREIATAIFQELGYDAAAVSSGESALKYLDSHPVDLLLLDMIMEPGMDGLETYQRVLSRNPEQKAVIASGYTKNERVSAALHLGATFVHKPYRLEEIAKAVKYTLNAN